MNRKPAMTPLHRSRRLSVIGRLETQLKSGVKPLKENDDEKITLSDKDRTRIHKEIDVLKTRV